MGDKLGQRLKITAIWSLIGFSLLLLSCSDQLFKATNRGALPKENPKYHIRQNIEHGDLKQVKSDIKVQHVYTQNDQSMTSKGTQTPSAITWIKNAMTLQKIKVHFDEQKQKIQIFGETSLKNEPNSNISFSVNLCLEGDLDKSGTTVLTQTHSSDCSTPMSDFFVSARWNCLDERLNPISICNNYFIEFFVRKNQYVFSNQWHKLTPATSHVKTATKPDEDHGDHEDDEDEYDEIDEDKGNGEYIGGFIPLPKGKDHYPDAANDDFYDIEDSDSPPPSKFDPQKKLPILDVRPTSTKLPIIINPVKTPPNDPPSPKKDENFSPQKSPDVENNSPKVLTPTQPPPQQTAPHPSTQPQPPRTEVPPSSGSAPPKVQEQKQDSKQNPSQNERQQDQKIETPPPPSKQDNKTEEPSKKLTNPTSTPYPRTSAPNDTDEKLHRIREARPIPPINIDVFRNQSVGASYGGYLQNASSLKNKAEAFKANGEAIPFRLMRASKQRYYGNEELIQMLIYMGQTLNDMDSNRVLELGDLSAKKGGPISGHRSHQSGIDADVGFLLKSFPKNYYGQSIVANRGGVISDFMIHEQWDLLKKFLKSYPKKIHFIFVHREVKRSFCRFARQQGEFYEDKDSRNDPLAAELLRRLYVQKGHDDHFHLRIKCPLKDKNCFQQSEIPPKSGC